MSMDSRWGIWDGLQQGRQGVCMRLCIKGQEVRGVFDTQDEAMRFQAAQLKEHLEWPRKIADAKIERDPLWDHPEELEPQKEYSFRGPLTAGGRHSAPSPVAVGGGRSLSVEQLKDFEAKGFLLGLPVLGPEELAGVRAEFDELLQGRVGQAPSEEARFRAAHTLSRPLHQDLVAKLVHHERTLHIVEDLLGPHFVCWSAHLFCKLPGDPTQQPWHQDAGFWPLSASRALTLWLAFDDTDAANAAVSFVAGSHRLGRLPWQRTSSKHHLLTQEIPDVDLLGPVVPSRLRAGEASVHCDLTVHGSPGNFSGRRRAGLALRFVAADADCLGPMINGYRMNNGCILPKGKASDPRGHWKALRRRPGGTRPRRRTGGGGRDQGCDQPELAPVSADAEDAAEGAVVGGLQS